MPAGTHRQHQKNPIPGLLMVYHFTINIIIMIIITAAMLKLYQRCHFQDQPLYKLSFWCGM
jgi:hypothetical protein